MRDLHAIRRVFESLVLSRLLVERARAAGNAHREMHALTGVCVARYGLYMGADLSEDVARLRELVPLVPADEENGLGVHLEYAYVEYAHAMGQGDFEVARVNLDAFGKLALRGEQDRRLALCVLLGCRAQIALASGQPETALSLLAEIDGRAVADPYHAPELSVLRVRARVAVGELDQAREDAATALAAIEGAPAAAMSDCIHYGSQLAELLEGALDDVDGARRAYDTVATSVLRRIRQIDGCLDALPELVAGSEADLIRYRKASSRSTGALLERVAEMFRRADADDLRARLLAEPHGAFFAICAWCESVRGEDGRWRGFGHLVPREGPFQVTHAICPTCAAEM